MNLKKINRHKGNKYNSAVELRKSDDSRIYLGTRISVFEFSEPKLKKALKMPEQQ